MSAWTPRRQAVARAVRMAGLVVAFTVFALGLASQPHATAKAGTIPDIERLPTAELAQKMRLKLPDSPTADEIHRVALLGAPLVPVGSTSPAENRDLARALEAYDVTREGERHRDAVEPILRFLDTHPDSGWRPTLLVGLGAVYRRTGHFSKALSTWQRAWDIAKGFQDVDGRSVGDQAAAYLSQYEAYLGRKETLGPLLQEAQARTVSGTARDVLAQSAQGLAEMLYQPQISFRCGPMALNRILTRPGQTPSLHSIDVLQRATSTPDGLSLSAVQAISVEADMNYQMAFRTPGSGMITPSVAHWTVGHYAAVAGKVSGDRYAIEDPTFGPDLTIDQPTLDEEASGYFLVPQGPLPPGWRPVGPTEGATVWGRGNTADKHDDGATGPSALHAFTDHACPGGCTTWNVEAEVVGLSLHDDPISYTPPVGPAVHFPVEYSQRDKQLSQSSLTYTSFGIGTPWTTDWTSFIIPSENCQGIYSAAPVLEILGGGGNTAYTVAILPTISCPNLYERGGGIEPFFFDQGPADASPGYNPCAEGTVVSCPSWLPVSGQCKMAQSATGPFSQTLLTAYCLDGQDAGANAFGDAGAAAAGVPIGYSRLHRDGSVEQYAQPYSSSCSGSVNYSSAIFMTAVIDPQGNAITIEYDCNNRITALVDALGQRTTIGYGPDLPNRNPLEPAVPSMVVRTITDPFDPPRIAYFSYYPPIDIFHDPTQLQAIVDDIGITSAFTYSTSTSSFVNSLATPYGTTTFSFQDESFQNESIPLLPSNTGGTPITFDRAVQVSEPLNRTSLVEFVQGTDTATDYNCSPGGGSCPNGTVNDSDCFDPNLYVRCADVNVPNLTGLINTTLNSDGDTIENAYLNWRNTFVWTPEEYAAAKSSLAATPYLAAKIIHWDHSFDFTKAGRYVDSIKEPLQSRVWFMYEGQSLNTQLIPTLGPNNVGVTSGAIDLPSGVARVLPDGSTQFTQYAYNPLGNVTEFIDPIGRTTLHCYGPTPCNSTTNYVDLQLVDNTAGGIVWQAPSYNQQHEPLEVIPPGVYTSWQFQYNSVGQPQTVTDPYGNVTTYHYGTATGTPAASGYLLSWDSPAVTPPGSTDAGATQIATVSFTYDGYGRIASTTDPGGETIKRQYDNANRLALLTFPDLSTEQFQYINLDLWLTTDRVATNPPTLRTYDALRRVTQIQGPTGVTHIEYDPNGPIDGTVVVEDPNGNQTIYEHLFEGELSEISNQDGTSTIFAYDGMSSTPQAGGVGGVPRVVQVAKGVKSGVPFHQTFYTYNADDTLSSIQPQNPYSSAGVAPTMATNPLSTFFTWDPDFRRLTGWAQGNFFGLGVGAVSDESYTYNPFPQSPGSPSLEGGSTGAGLLNNVTDLWIPQGPESSEPSLNFVSYNYDSFGRVSERQVSTTFTPASVSFDESFTYDAIGRLSTDSNSLDTFTYNYSDGTSRPSSRTSADGGPQISYGYYGPTNDNLLKQATYTTLANSQIAAFSYAFDDDHEMTQFGETYAGGRTNQTTYEYKNGALAGTIPTSVSQPGLTTNYIQDPAGNPTFIQGASTLAPGAIVNMTSNDMNEIASLNEVASGGVTTLPSPSYDPDGNLLTAELGSPATYSYDAYDRLQSITYMTTDEKLQFFYDGVGRLSEIVDTVGEQVLQDHTYFWCGDERCFERDQTELDSYGAAPVVDKVYFSQGKLYGFGAGLSPAYYVTDALGSVREEMAASTSEVSSLGQFEYDPYGNDTPVQGVGYTNGLHDIGFAGYFEPGTLPGLAFARNRVYAPGIGRWLTRDPIGNGRAFWDLRHFNSVDVDLYAYARNNPSSYIDPSGNDLATALAGLAGGALVGGVSAYLADAPAGEIFAGAVAGGAGGFVVGFIDPAALGGTFAGIGIGVAGAALAGGGWGSIVTNGIAGGVAGGISGAFGGLPGVAVTSMLALPLGITASVVGDAIDDAQKEATGEDTENGTCHQ